MPGHLARQRRGVGADRHRDRGLVDGDPRQRVRVLGVGQGVADHDLGHTRHGDDVTGDGLVGGGPVHALGGQQFGDLGVRDDRMAVDLAHPRDLLALADPALVDADQREPAEERRRVEVGHQCLQRGLGVTLRRRDVLEQHVEQRVEVLAVGVLAVGGLGGAGDARAARRVQRRQSERELGGLLRLLVEIGRDVEQQVVALRDDLGDAGVGPVGLVDHQDHRQMRGQRLAQHEAGLRQRALGRVDQQQHAVDHGQPAFDLATEVGVARGVDDVDDRHAAVGVLTVHRGVLRQDRDALFLLQVTGVHQAFDGVVTAMGQRAGLPQHRVDQGRLPVVDVCDDGDIPEIHVVNCRSAVLDRENERHPGRSLEGQQARRPQTEEEVLPQQAALQELPGGAAQGAQGRTQRASAARSSRRCSSAPERLTTAADARFGRTVASVRSGVSPCGLEVANHDGLRGSHHRADRRAGTRRRRWRSISVCSTGWATRSTSSGARRATT